MAFGLDLLGGVASIAGGLLGGRGRAPAETKMQKTQRKLVDQLISSLSGQGPYSDLFKGDDATFQRSFVDPAMSRFRNQIAPQIQQQYAATGQHLNSGLDDQLLRAGVDLNANLDQYAYQHQQDALNRKQNALSGILGAGPGAQNQPSFGQDVMSTLGGYLSSPGFANTADRLFSSAPPVSRNYQSPRRGFDIGQTLGAYGGMR